MALVNIEGGSGFRPAGSSLASKLAGAAQSVSQTTQQAAQRVQEPAKQAGYEWFNDGTPEGAYRDPATSNIWKSGTWWNANGDYWDEQGGAWTSPGALRGAIEHDQAISNTFGQLPPEGAQATA